jgi:hypothetical protein
MTLRWRTHERSPLVDVWDGVRCRYVGMSEHVRDAACILTEQPFPPPGPIFYFEIRIVSTGRRGYAASIKPAHHVIQSHFDVFPCTRLMSVGFSTSGSFGSKHPGILRLLIDQAPISVDIMTTGTDAHSYGYHGDDGMLYTQGGSGVEYGAAFESNDVIGCCINLIDNTFFFTRNGSKLGAYCWVLLLADIFVLWYRYFDLRRFQSLLGSGTISCGALKTARGRDKMCALYPCIGMQSAQEEIEANFGAKPFVFGIQSYINVRIRLMRAICITKHLGLYPVFHYFAWLML